MAVGATDWKDAITKLPSRVPGRDAAIRGPASADRSRFDRELAASRDEAARPAGLSRRSEAPRRTESKAEPKPRETATASRATERGSVARDLQSPARERSDVVDAAPGLVNDAAAPDEAAKVAGSTLETAKAVPPVADGETGDSPIVATVPVVLPSVTPDRGAGDSLGDGVIAAAALLLQQVPVGPAQPQAPTPPALEAANTLVVPGIIVEETDGADLEDAKGEEAEANAAAVPPLVIGPLLVAPTPVAIQSGSAAKAPGPAPSGVPSLAAAGESAGLALDALKPAEGRGAASETGPAVLKAAGSEGGSAAIPTPVEATSSAVKPDVLAAMAESLQATAPTPTPTEALLGQTGLAASGPGHAAATAEKAGTASPAPPVPIGQVPMTIGLRSLSGSSQFEIRLDPGELGRIDVKLEIDKERGTVTTHLVVERIDTLAMLQRDANSLQQALGQAGFEAAEGSISMSLRGDGGTGGQSDQGEQQARSGHSWTTEAAEAAHEAIPLRTLRGLGNLDIRI